MDGSVQLVSAADGAAIRSVRLAPPASTPSVPSRPVSSISTEYGTAVIAGMTCGPPGVVPTTWIPWYAAGSRAGADSFGAMVNHLASDGQPRYGCQDSDT